MTTDFTLSEPIVDSVAVAAKRLGVGRANLYKEIAAGRLWVRKFGRRTLVERSEQERWIAALPYDNARAVPIEIAAGASA